LPVTHTQSKINHKPMSELEQAIKRGVRRALNEEKKKKEVRSVVREALSELLTEDDDYQEFVQGVMNTLGIDSPQDLTEEGRERFFNLLGNHYNEATDEADDVPMDDIKDQMEPEHFKNGAPDFLKKEERVRKAARKVVRQVLNS